MDDAWIGSWVQLSCQLLRVDSPLKKFPSQAESLWSVYEVTSRVPRNKIVKTSDVAARSSSIAARLTNPVFWQLIPVCFLIISTNDILVIIKGRLPDYAKGFSTLSIRALAWLTSNYSICDWKALRAFARTLWIHDFAAILKMLGFLVTWYDTSHMCEASWRVLWKRSLSVDVAHAMSCFVLSSSLWLQYSARFQIGYEGFTKKCDCFVEKGLSFFAGWSGCPLRTDFGQISFLAAKQQWSTARELQGVQEAHNRSSNKM